MKQLASDEERKKQEILKQKRELELKNKLREEEERKKMKEIKRLERLEKKRQETASNEQIVSEQEKSDADANQGSAKNPAKNKKYKKLADCLRFTLIFVFISTLIFFVFTLCCENISSMSGSFIDTKIIHDVCFKYSINDASFLKRLFQ